MLCILLLDATKNKNPYSIYAKKYYCTKKRLP